MMHNKMADRPESADGRPKVLRQVNVVAIQVELVASNPAVDVELIKSDNLETFYSCTLDEVE